MFIGGIIAGIGLAISVYGAYKSNEAADNAADAANYNAQQQLLISQASSRAQIQQASIVSANAAVLRQDAEAMSAFSTSMANANRSLATGAIQSQLGYNLAAADLKNSSLVLIKADAAFQTSQLEVKKDLVERQAKADALIRHKSYNKVMENSVVQAAASGRVMGEGSVKALFAKSEENFQWETLWNQQNTIISTEAIKADQKAIEYSSKVQYKLGEAGVTIDKIGANVTAQSAAATAQASFNNALVGIQASAMMSKSQISQLEANSAAIKAGAATATAQAELGVTNASTQGDLARQNATTQGIVDVGGAVVKGIQSIPTTP